MSFVNNPQLPFSELILKLNGGRLCAAGQPARLRPRVHQLIVHPLLEHAASPAPLPSPPPAAPHRCRSLPRRAPRTARPRAVRSPPSRSTLTRGDGQQYLSIDQHHSAGRPRRLDPVGHAVPRTAGAAGTCAVDEPGRHRHGDSGLRHPLRVLRPGVPHRAQPAARPTASRSRSRQRPDRSTSAVVTTRIALGVDPHTARVIATGSTADDRQGRAAAPAYPERVDQQAQLPVQPDQLRRAQHRLARSAPSSAATKALSCALPGQQL